MDPVLTPWLLELGKNGLLAVLLIIVGFMYFRKDKTLFDLYEKRVQDTAKIITVIEATNAGYRALEVASENRSRVIDSVGEAVHTMAEAVKNQGSGLDQIRNRAERNSDYLERLERSFAELRREIDAGKK